MLLVERAWPPLVWALAVAALFLALSWFGVWLVAPPVMRVGGVVLFALALLAALAPLARLRWPGARDITARLDRDAGADHRPATSLADSLANDQDPVARALWAEHQARLARAVEAIRVAPPAPGMAERDPYALRFGAALLAFAAAVAAGPELYNGFASAFDWRGGAFAAAAGSRIDAWIDPPPYAGRAPVIIDVKNADPQTMTVFEDSTLVVRGDPAVVETRVEGPISLVDEKAAPPQAPSPERRWTIHGDGKATILRGGSKAADIAFSVTPTGVPTIRLTEDPKANISGSLTLAYRLGDRYGVAGARADFALPHDPAKPAPRSLAQPPEAALETPATGNGVGDARSTLDLSEHPWAGARVMMTLSAQSVSGKSGASAPVEVTLPQRPFHNPLARALVEERRDLILDPDHAPKSVETALDGLSVAPELFDTPANVYLGLKQARTSLSLARGDADLLDVAALLWAMAQQIEDGDATQAERDLRAAEQALREALQRGASDEEIKKLMQNLREAARRFANEMAKDAEQSPQDSQEQAQDLDKLMDRMEDAARNGTREEAEAMLDQMQEMFENMRGSRNAEESQAERAMRKQIDELQKLLRDQQALRDETFRSDQRDRGQRRRQKRPSEGQSEQAQPDDGQDQGDNDQNPSANPDQQDGNPADAELGQRQHALSDRLAELQRRLKSLGLKGEKGFDDAQKDMQEAEGDLKGDQGDQAGHGGTKPHGQSGKGAAVDAQGRALEALRDGAQGMQKQMGQGQNGKSGYTARRKGPGEQSGDDPLGRGREGNFGREEGSLRETAGGAERARRVLEELRRRLADPNRPVDERDYLERLMKHD
ncbi:MAG: TIGR02302 family protein [Hyphomicrobiales bacterium]|nr:TIGR02302 family protein [Hyphomicrobiales bacterium]